MNQQKVLSTKFYQPRTFWTISFFLKWILLSIIAAIRCPYWEKYRQKKKKIWKEIHAKVYIILQYIFLITYLEKSQDGVGLCVSLRNTASPFLVSQHRKFHHIAILNKYCFNKIPLLGIFSCCEKYKWVEIKFSKMYKNVWKRKAHDYPVFRVYA